MGLKTNCRGIEFPPEGPVWVHCEGSLSVRYSARAATAGEESHSVKIQTWADGQEPVQRGQTAGPGNEAQLADDKGQVQDTKS